MYHTNTEKFRERASECGVTYASLAQAMGIARCTLYRRLRSSTLRVKDIQTACEMLNLAPADAISIFLAE